MLHKTLYNGVDICPKEWLSASKGEVGDLSKVFGNLCHLIKGEFIKTVCLADWLPVEAIGASRIAHSSHIEDNIAGSG